MVCIQPEYVTNLENSVLLNELSVKASALGPLITKISSIQLIIVGALSNLSSSRNGQLLR